jgi:hypothetical protein
MDTRTAKIIHKPNFSFLKFSYWRRKRNCEVKRGIIICSSREMDPRELNWLQSPAEDRGVMGPAGRYTCPQHPVEPPTWSGRPPSVIVLTWGRRPPYPTVRATRHECICSQYTQPSGSLRVDLTWSEFDSRKSNNFFVYQGKNRSRVPSNKESVLAIFIFTNF